MEHGAYKVSEETKAKLIEAAGELFSYRGTEAVSLREITDRAGTVPNSVCYHFGDKDGLVEAVRQYALRLWDDGRIERYYMENESLLNTRDGRRQMVTDTIDLYYGIICAEGQPRWVIRLLLRALLTSQWQGERHEAIARRIIDTFCRIYGKITGNDDRMTAVCWAMAIIAPGSLLATSEYDFVHFREGKGVDYAFLRRLQTMITRNALLSLGLD
ncbi:MAG: TetR/AcrR family transcriptional regulator [Lentisphaeria bacterium]|nr:TetR/AcrR family transcriptional regulator [Lentisphaeria bacterium]